MVFSIFLQSFFSVCLKFAADSSGIVVLILVGLAFFFIFLKAVFWQKVIEVAELSAVYPFLSLVQILIFVYSVVLFHEVIYIENILGLATIILGLFVFSSGLRRS